MKRIARIRAVIATARAEGGHLPPQTQTGPRTVLPDYCRTYWGSHGCYLLRGHEGHHVCICCDDPANHTAPDHDEACVGTWPYYGEKTWFYGDDVPAPKEGR